MINRSYCDQNILAERGGFLRIIFLYKLSDKNKLLAAC